MYEISFSPGPDHLRVDLKGDFADPQTRVDAWTEIIKRCRDDGVTRLIVVQDSPGGITPTTAFVSSHGVVELGLEGIRIAFADLNSANYDVNYLGELIALDRGADAKVFFDENAAIEWLLHDQ